MTDQQHITINYETINKFSVEFTNLAKSNPFYNKDVFFTEGFGDKRFIEYQIVGNLGGHPNDYEFNVQTDFYIIADSLINDLRQSKKSTQLKHLEEKLNDKGKKYQHLWIISESAFLKHVHKRCIEIGDKVTLALINKVL